MEKYTTAHNDNESPEEEAERWGQKLRWEALAWIMSKVLPEQPNQK